MVFQSIFFAITAYLLGSIPFGKIIAGAVARIDITRRGSGNIGATNVARELNVTWGLITLVLDMLKGFLPVVFFTCCVSRAGAGHEIGLTIVALCALLGHQFSLFLKFRGGKGVGTALGLYLGISPLCSLIAILLFILIVWKWDFISLASMVSASAMPVLFGLSGTAWPLIVVSLVIAALVCLKHRENIQRLVTGKENKWSGRRRQPSNSRSLSNSSSE